MRSFLLSMLLISACGKNNEPPPPSSGVPNAPTESGPSRPHPQAAGDTAAPPAAAAGNPAEIAAAKFGTMCALCHGADGTGNGPAAATLNPKPRNYTDAAWQASITDEQIKKTILEGGQAVGKSPIMPGNPDLADKPEVVDALVQIIRKFGKH